MDIRIPVGDWIDGFVNYVIENFSAFFRFLREIFVGMYDAVDWVLRTPPFWVILVVAVVLALLARGWIFAVGTAAGLLLIASMDQWDNAMDTLALVSVAAFIAIALSIPIGIAAARSRLVSAIVRPILDFLQTMPAFVYLIPAILLFRVGEAPGIVATIVFAMAPGVRLTELGLRGVDTEVVEAGHAFGATPARILRQIQLPLALPTIMAGVNQVIMLSLSMVVIAGLVGADGLGSEIVASLARLDTALGVEAGLSVVILAILLDRFTGSFGQRRGLLAAVQARSVARRREAEAAPASPMTAA
ncbi:proline/glycine betaine ABC transporter permease [Homoserinibacter sp. GY 40078]|uniref:ABC transporter permease n=1 Tax=Homoserinibacter sp. GY 40078 TaxID=2603275 RepID=UPI0011C96D95|nr:proline/glycine betaine ABC transporter permease [Homoserinibacter sp. GY 40078]TXK19650.1 proline/glycine betaine ABC transporter permease [Homoserinibacter sp. GY 40078]